MPATTDSAYNSKSRMLESMLKIYFDEADPLIVTKNDYLIAWDLLEEVSADNSVPFSTVSANELSFELVNTGDIFNPANIGGAYYNKIKTGVLVELYIRPISTGIPYDWDKLGEFYLTDWQVGFAASTVSATATDQISRVINATRVKLPVSENISYSAFITSFFTKVGAPITIDPPITGTLRYGYHIAQNADFLNNVAGGLQVFIYCNHNGSIVARYMHETVALAHTISDDDQIIEPTTKQSILLQYDGASVCAKIPQLSPVTTLYTEPDIDTSEATPFTDRAFSNIPVANVTYVQATGDGLPNITALQYNATDILNFTLQNAFKGRVELCGQYIQTIDVYNEDPNCKNALKFSSIYIQTEDYLRTFKAFMDAYVRAPLPIVEVTVRGNPRMELGQKIRVQSDRFRLDFTGILIRQALKYDGGLSGTLTLLNASVLEVSEP